MLKCTIVITCCLSSDRPSSLTFHILDFSTTAEQNSTKLDRERDINILYQVYVFQTDRKTKMSVLASDGIGWDFFDFFIESTKWNSAKLDRKKEFNILYKVCVFRADRKTKMAALASDLLMNFRLLLSNRWREFNETWQEESIQHSLQSLCFLADRKSNMTALANALLIHFRLHLWNG